MKKLNLLFFVFLIVTFFACSEANVLEKHSSSSMFAADLTEYLAAQKMIMQGVGTRSVGELYSREEVAAVAAKLDSVALEFYKDHPDVYNDLPKVSSEKLDVLKENTDSLIAFVNVNYSPEVLQLVNEKLNVGHIPQIGTSKGPVCSNQFVDGVIKANIEINMDFKKNILDNSELLPIEQKNNTECYVVYKKKVDGCYESMVRNLVIAAIGASAVPGGVAVFSVTVLYIAADYNQCLYNAAEYYNLCIGKR